MPGIPLRTFITQAGIVLRPGEYIRALFPGGEPPVAGSKQQAEKRCRRALHQAALPMEAGERPNFLKYFSCASV